jgi:hypothetical protein
MLINQYFSTHYKIRPQKMEGENTRKCIVFVKETVVEQDIVFFGKTIVTYMYLLN